MSISRMPGTLIALLAGLLGAATAQAQPLDATPRTAIISAFPPEIGPLRALMGDAREVSVNGTHFYLGTIAGKPVVLFLSGVSMVNAAMTSQLALDRLRIVRIIFSGVAGGVDPKLTMGDVVVPERWSEYLETTFARADGKGGYTPVARFGGEPSRPNFGMIYPVRALALRQGADHPEARIWFEADPALLAVARSVAGGLTLDRCLAEQCLAAAPHLIVGGNGVSGSAFVDNAEFRDWTRKTFDAEVLDMESAAVAHVAWTNQVPFIAFRSLSDLAGGDAGPNQARLFYALASRNAALMVGAFLKALP